MIKRKTIYHALILDEDSTILSVLRGGQAITPELLSNTAYAGKTIYPVEKEAEYSTGKKLAEYTGDGKLRPILDRVKEGLCEPPQGYQLVDGELVPSNPTPEETPERLQNTIDALRAQVVALQKELIGL